MKVILNIADKQCGDKIEEFLKENCCEGKPFKLKKLSKFLGSRNLVTVDYEVKKYLGQKISDREILVNVKTFTKWKLI
tara:strand:+ start:797 stop:1030 length:234 start_codon:yes stop_codon:yes gene_type:complete